VYAFVRRLFAGFISVGVQLSKLLPEYQYHFLKQYFGYPKELVKKITA